MKLTKGLVSDVRPIDQPEGTYRNAKNILINAHLGAVSNELGTASRLNISGTILGSCQYGDEQVYLFISDTIDKIVQLDTNSLGNTTTIIESNDLNFQIGYFIDSRIIKNYKGERILYFTDGYNSPRFINIDRSPSSIGQIFPQYNSYPNFTLENVVTGGSLKTGVYYIGFSYVDEDDSESNILILSNEIVVTDDYQLNFTKYDGAEEGLLTNKKIVFSLSNLDVSYKEYKIYLIRKENNTIAEVKALQSNKLSQTVNVEITGSETFTESSIEEILINKAYYNKAKTLEIQNDRLYLANLESDQEIEYQQYANQIIVEAVEETINDTIENSYKNSVVINNKRSFKSDEIYAFYISFILKNGRETKAFHIPGRQASNVTEEGQLTGSIEVLGTVTRLSESITITFLHDDVSGNTSTTIKYIASQNTTAENVAIALTALFQAESNLTNLFTITRVGSEIQFTRNVNVTSELFIQYVKNSPLDGIDINITNIYDSLTENSLIGSTYNTEFEEVSLITDEAKYFHFSTGIKVNGMGYWENKSEVYPDDFPDFAGQNVRHHRFPQKNQIAFDIPNAADNSMPDTIYGIKLKNIIIPAAIKNNVIGYKVYYAEQNLSNKTCIGQPIIFHTRTEDGNDNPSIKIKPVGVPNNGKQFIGYDFNLLRTRNSIGSVTHFKTLNRYQTTIDTFNGSTRQSYIGLARDPNYIPTNKAVLGKAYIQNNVDKVPLSQYGFTSDILTKKNTSAIALEPVRGITPTQDISQYWLAYRVDLKSFKTDLYKNFDSQNLVHTGYFEDLSNFGLDSPSQNLILSESNPIFGGTHYIGLTYLGAQEPNETWRFVIPVYGESPDNVFIRREGTSVDQRYFPKSDLDTVVMSDISENIRFQADNFYGYMESLGVNTIKPTFTKEIDIDTNLPTRIIRSRSSSLIKNSYRDFLENDFIDLPRNQQEIVKLTNVNNKLFIHTKRNLLFTVGREELVVGDIRAFIGQGDILANAPNELVNVAEGYAGLDNLQHALNTRFGYTFFDKQSGALFLLNDGIKEISTQNIYNELRTKIEDYADFRIGFDPIYRRFLYTKTTGTPFTISYLPELQTWVSYHDYHPSYYVHTRNKFYSLKNGVLYEHLVEKPCYFYGTQYSSMIDVCFPTQDLAVLESISTLHEIENFVGNIPIKDSFSQYRVYNDIQDSGLLDFTSNNVRMIEGKYYFNEFLDIKSYDGDINSIKEWWQKNPFIHRYFQIQLYHIKDNQKLFLYSIDAKISKHSEL